MNRPFLASVVARDRKNEIPKELAMPHMRREAESDESRVSKQMDWQLAFPLILIALLALFLVG